MGVSGLAVPGRTAGVFPALTVNPSDSDGFSPAVDVVPSVYEDDTPAVVFALSQHQHHYNTATATHAAVDVQPQHSPLLAALTLTTEGATAGVMAPVPHDVFHQTAINANIAGIAAANAAAAVVVAGPARPPASSNSNSNAATPAVASGQSDAGSARGPASRSNADNYTTTRSSATAAVPSSSPSSNSNYNTRQQQQPQPSPQQLQSEQQHEYEQIQLSQQQQRAPSSSYSVLTPTHVNEDFFKPHEMNYAEFFSPIMQQTHATGGFVQAPNSAFAPFANTFAPGGLNNAHNNSNVVNGAADLTPRTDGMSFNIKLNSNTIYNNAIAPFPHPSTFKPYFNFAHISSGADGFASLFGRGPAAATYTSKTTTQTAAIGYVDPAHPAVTPEPAVFVKPSVLSDWACSLAELSARTAVAQAQADAETVALAQTRRRAAAIKAKADAAEATLAALKARIAAKTTVDATNEDRQANKTVASPRLSQSQVVMLQSQAALAALRTHVAAERARVEALKVALRFASASVSAAVAPATREVAAAVAATGGANTNAKSVIANANHSEEEKCNNSCSPAAAAAAELRLPLWWRPAVDNVAADPVLRSLPPVRLTVAASEALVANAAAPAAGAGARASGDAQTGAADTVTVNADGAIVARNDVCLVPVVPATAADAMNAAIAYYNACSQSFAAFNASGPRSLRGGLRHLRAAQLLFATTLRLPLTRSIASSSSSSPVTQAALVNKPHGAGLVSLPVLLAAHFQWHHALRATVHRAVAARVLSVVRIFDVHALGSKVIALPEIADCADDSDDADFTDAGNNNGSDSDSDSDASEEGKIEREQLHDRKDDTDVTYTSAQFRPTLLGPIEDQSIANNSTGKNAAESNKRHTAPTTHGFVHQNQLLDVARLTFFSATVAIPANIYILSDSTYTAPHDTVDLAMVFSQAVATHGARASQLTATPHTAIYANASTSNGVTPSSIAGGIGSGISAGLARIANLGAGAAAYGINGVNNAYNNAGVNFSANAGIGASLLSVDVNSRNEDYDKIELDQANARAQLHSLTTADPYGNINVMGRLDNDGSVTGGCLLPVFSVKCPPVGLAADGATPLHRAVHGHLLAPGDAGVVCGEYTASLAAMIMARMLPTVTGASGRALLHANSGKKSSNSPAMSTTPLMNVAKSNNITADVTLTERDCVSAISHALQSARINHGFATSTVDRYLHCQHSAAADPSSGFTAGGGAFTAHGLNHGYLLAHSLDTTSHLHSGAGAAGTGGGHGHSAHSRPAALTLPFPAPHASIWALAAGGGSGGNSGGSGGSSGGLVPVTVSNAVHQGLSGQSELAVALRTATAYSAEYLDATLGLGVYRSHSRSQLQPQSNSQAQTGGSGREAAIARVIKQWFQWVQRYKSSNKSNVSAESNADVVPGLSELFFYLALLTHTLPATAPPVPVEPLLSKVTNSAVSLVTHGLTTVTDTVRRTFGAGSPASATTAALGATTAATIAHLNSQSPESTLPAFPGNNDSDTEISPFVAFLISPHSPLHRHAQRLYRRPLAPAAGFPTGSAPPPLPGAGVPPLLLAARIGAYLRGSAWGAALATTNYSDINVSNGGAVTVRNEHANAGADSGDARVAGDLTPDNAGAVVPETGSSGNDRMNNTSAVVAASNKAANTFTSVYIDLLVRFLGLPPNAESLLRCAFTLCALFSCTDTESYRESFAPNVSTPSKAYTNSLTLSADSDVVATAGRAAVLTASLLRGVSAATAMRGAYAVAAGSHNAADLMFAGAGQYPGQHAPAGGAGAAVLSVPVPAAYDSDLFTLLANSDASVNSTARSCSAANSNTSPRAESVNACNSVANHNSAAAAARAATAAGAVASAISTSGRALPAVTPWPSGLYRYPTLPQSLYLAFTSSPAGTVARLAASRASASAALQYRQRQQH